MTENEDKLIKTLQKDNNFKEFLDSFKYVLNIPINFKKLLEALLLEYIDFTQYEIHF